jgi:hypothetical protein
MNTRSNRRVTEFACSLLDFFLLKSFRGSGVRSAGNTRVSYRITRQAQVFQVDLYEEPILRVFCEEWQPCSIWIGVTTFFDSNGAPSRTTRERLNGLLDRLGAHGVIPAGVRVFRDPDSSPDAASYRVGCRSCSVPVGEGVATCLYISPGSGELKITGTALEADLGKVDVVL